MSTVVDRNRAVANYLRTRTGITEIRYDKASRGIDAPFPYGFTVATSRSLSHVAEKVAALPTKGLPAIIRYDLALPSIDDAWVIWRLAAVPQLLTAHYNSAEMAGRNEA